MLVEVLTDIPVFELDILFVIVPESLGTCAPEDPPNEPIPNKILCL